MSEDTYPMPKHGWTCFFCGDTFKTPGGAKDHFGGNLGSTTACKIKFEEIELLMAYRKLETELRNLRARVSDEDTEKDRQINSMISKHAQELKREEEKGYARGLEDGIKHQEDILAARS